MRTMTKRGRSSKSTLSAEMGASARLSASASYQVHKEVTQVIPDDVTRAKASAWLTLISPLTEWAGLKADEIAHKRDLLRLFREETLTAIAKRVHAKIGGQATIQPVPPKFLVPFLEKASLDDADSELVDLWANLLLSAAENYEPHYPFFINLISQLSGREAVLFQKLIRTKSARDVDKVLWKDLTIEYLGDRFIQVHIDYAYRGRQPGLQNRPGSLKKCVRMLQGLFDKPGIVVEQIECTDNHTNESYFDVPDYSIYGEDDENEMGLHILDAIDLIHYVDSGDINLDDRFTVKVLLYHLTPLGYRFAKACKIVDADDESDLKRRSGGTASKANRKPDRPRRKA